MLEGTDMKQTPQIAARAATIFPDISTGATSPTKYSSLQKTSETQATSTVADGRQRNR